MAPEVIAERLTAVQIHGAGRPELFRQRGVASNGGIALAIHSRSPIWLARRRPPGDPCPPRSDETPFESARLLQVGLRRYGVFT